MSARLLLVALVTASVIAIAGSAHALPDGGYIAIGFGGAVASGDHGVPLKPSSTAQITVQPGNPIYDEIVRTDFGSGLGAELRFGYLIAKLIAPEVSACGHGATSFDDGAGFVSFALRYHFVQHFMDLAERPWDLDVYFGGGYAIGGYHPAKFDTKGKGWEGWELETGVDFEYQLGERVGLALDVKFVLPQYGTYIWNYDDKIRFDAQSTPSTLVVMPTLQVIFHL